jgi:hypothetical protein
MEGRVVGSADERSAHVARHPAGSGLRLRRGTAATNFLSLLVRERSPGSQVRHVAYRIEGQRRLDVAVDAVKPDYADARIRLRPARVAVVFDGGDDWHYWARLAIYAAS